MNLRLATAGRNAVAVAWVEVTAGFYGLTGITRALLWLVASNACFKLWRRFFMSIDTIRKLLGCSRSSVDKALKTLRDLKLIAYDGQVHVGKRRPVAVYRLSGTPECPLPEWVVQARHEAWEDAQGAAEDPYDETAENAVTSHFTLRTDQDTRVETCLQSSYARHEVQDPSLLPGAVYLYRSALLTKTEPQDSQNLVGNARWVPHLEPARTHKRAVRAATGLLGRVWGLTPGEALRGALGRSGGRKDGSPAGPGAVSYSHTPIGGATAMPTPFTDPTLGTLTRDTRLFYLGLRSLAEDGQILSDPRYLKGEIFRYDDDITPGDIVTMCDSLTEAGKIHNVPGYLVLSDIPTDDNALFALPAPVKSKTDPETAFEAFWKIYPKRQGKGAAKKAFLKQCATGLDPLVVVSAATSYAQRCRELSKEAQFIPNPSTWLNQERYDDDPEEAPTVRSRSDDAFRQNMSLVEFYERQEGLERGDQPRELGR